MAGRLALAAAIALGWGAAAYLLNGVFLEALFIAIMGGFAEPPQVWLAVHAFGVRVLPPLFLLGGLPAAVQAARGRPVPRVLGATLAAFAALWGAVMLAVFWLPGAMGWVW